jgi:hypothetical protein
MAPLGGLGKGPRQADALAEATVTGRRALFVGEGPARIATTFEVVRPLAGPAPEAKAVVRTTVQWRGAAEARRVLLLLERTEDGPAFADALPDPDGRLSAYFAEALKPRPDAAQRAAFYAARLEDPDPEIAEDAFRGFADIPLPALRSAKAALPREKLREWLASDKVPAARKGLYGLMLGLCGSAEEDVPRLEKALSAAGDSASVSGGLLAGRAVLSGKPAETLSAVVSDAKAPMPRRRGALSVVRALWPEESLREGLRTALTAALSDAELAPFAIDEMARLADDRFTAELVALWSDPVRCTPAVRRAVRFYARSLPEPKRTEMEKRL